MRFVALDGSEQALRGARLVASLSLGADDEVLLAIHARKEMTPRQLLAQSHRFAARRRAEVAAQTLAAAGFRAVATVRAGPADTIVTHATARRSDLVVRSTLRLSEHRRRAIGSAPDKVVRWGNAAEIGLVHGLEIAILRMAT